MLLPAETTASRSFELAVVLSRRRSYIPAAVPLKCDDVI